MNAPHWLPECGSIMKVEPFNPETSVEIWRRNRVRSSSVMPCRDMAARQCRLILIWSRSAGTRFTDLKEWARFGCAKALNYRHSFMEAGRDRGCAQIGRAHVRTPVTNAHLVCSLLLRKKKKNITI